MSCCRLTGLHEQPLQSLARVLSAKFWAHHSWVPTKHLEWHPGVCSKTPQPWIILAKEKSKGGAGAQEGARLVLPEGTCGCLSPRIPCFPRLLTKNAVPRNTEPYTQGARPRN